MPLRSLQEIIIAYAQHLYEEGRFRALDSSIEYPYEGPAFAFKRNGDHFDLTDNTREIITFRTFRVAEIMRYHTFGNLPEPEITHGFC